jgi:hypothetical protein
MGLFLKWERVSLLRCVTCATFGAPKGRSRTLGPGLPALALVHLNPPGG